MGWESAGQTDSIYWDPYPPEPAHFVTAHNILCLTWTLPTAIRKGNHSSPETDRRNPTPKHLNEPPLFTYIHARHTLFSCSSYIPVQITRNGTNPPTEVYGILGSVRPTGGSGSGRKETSISTLLTAQYASGGSLRSTAVPPSTYGFILRILSHHTFS